MHYFLAAGAAGSVSSEVHSIFSIWIYFIPMFRYGHKQKKFKMCFSSLLDELFSWDDELCLPEAAGYGGVKQSTFVPSLTWSWTFRHRPWELVLTTILNFDNLEHI